MISLGKLFSSLMFLTQSSKFKKYIYILKYIFKYILIILFDISCFGLDFGDVRKWSNFPTEIKHDS